MNTSSALARKVAGTFVEDRLPAQPVARWFQKECREGRLAEAVQKFAQAQAEFIDPAMVVVESVTPDSVVCSIPCRQFDHESVSTFPMDVRFALDPETGATSRLGGV